MRCLSIIAFTALASSVAANETHARPWELVLRTSPLDGLCEPVAFRSAQINKGLLTQKVVKELTTVPAPRPSASQNTILRVTSHDVHFLLSQAQLHCSNDLSALFPSLGHPSIQVPFLRAHMLDVDLPPLELIPLITSGPAENRVDLAFFADGCM